MVEVSDEADRAFRRHLEPAIVDHATRTMVLLQLLREEGWSVAFHSDYKLNGEKFTFWLFTNGCYAAKGEGRTDLEALIEVEKRVREFEEDIPKSG